MSLADRVEVALRAHAPRKVLAYYVPRLIADLERIAAAKVMEAGLEGHLTFTAKISDDAKSITVTPSDPVLFRRLELGQFDAQGNLVAPAHSVLTDLRVRVGP